MGVRKNALVIQWIEWKSSKLTVAGSTPAKGTKNKKMSIDFSKMDVQTYERIQNLRKTINDAKIEIALLKTDYGENDELFKYEKHIETLEKELMPYEI